MASATLEDSSDIMQFVDPHLVKAAIGSVEEAFTMCNRKARCVGMSRIPSQDSGKITGMIGIHGKVSGFVTVNMSEQVAIKAVGGLLQEEYTKLTRQVVDGAGEITNIVVGGVKKMLGGTPWSFSDLTVPSVIIGGGYHIAYANGLEFLSVTFEHEDEDALMLDERLLQVNMSMLKL